MASIFVRPRDHSSKLLRTTRRKNYESRPSGLVLVGMGTAGCRRLLLLLQRLSELSETGRIQSAVFYDCNEATIDYIRRFLGKFLGKSRHRTGVQVVFPNYVPMPNGFMRDPQLFREFEGPLERDTDDIVSQIINQSERSGAAPEAIIEFMGFAGHAVLGGRLHRKLRTAFPSALMLPVLMLPEDHVAEEWTRRIIWDQYETLLEGANCLLTARVGGHFGEDDARLATGLAGIEVADFEEDGVAVSALAASCRRLSTTSGGWLGMATVKRKMPLARKFEWLHLPPWWRQYAAVGEDEELPNAVGQAIWASLDPPSQIAPGLAELNNSPQEVVVSLPVHPEALEPLATRSAETLERSNLFGRFQNMDIAFNTARFSEGLSGEPYLHVTRIYPVQGEVGPVMDILHPENGEGRRSGLTAHETGFGSFYHPEASAVEREYEAAEPAEEEDWRQYVRYI